MARKIVLKNPYGLKVLKTSKGYAVMDPDGMIGATDLNLDGAKMVLKSRTKMAKKKMMKSSKPKQKGLINMGSIDKLARF